MLCALNRPIIVDLIGMIQSANTSANGVADNKNSSNADLGDWGCGCGDGGGGDCRVGDSLLSRRLMKLPMARRARQYSAWPTSLVIPDVYVTRYRRGRLDGH